MTFIIHNGVCYFDLLSDEIISLKVFWKPNSELYSRIAISTNYNLHRFKDGKAGCIRNDEQGIDFENISDQDNYFKWGFVAINFKRLFEAEDDPFLIIYPNNIIQAGHIELLELEDLMINASHEHILLPYFYWYMLMESNISLFYSLISINYLPNSSYNIPFIDLVKKSPLPSNDFDIFL